MPDLKKLAHRACYLWIGNRNESMLHNRQKIVSVGMFRKMEQRNFSKLRQELEGDIRQREQQTLFMHCDDWKEGKRKRWELHEKGLLPKEKMGKVDTRLTRATTCTWEQRRN